jgi:hypothetical protein
VGGTLRFLTDADAWVHVCMDSWGQVFAHLHKFHKLEMWRKSSNRVREDDLILHEWSLLFTYLILHTWSTIYADYMFVYRTLMH